MDNDKNNANYKPKSPLRVSEERVGKAMNSLFKWVKSRAKSQDQNPKHDEFLCMVVTLKKQVTRIANPYRIPLRHPLFPLDGSQDICLIINDKEKGMNAEVATHKVKEEGLPISKVLKFSKLRTHYNSFEAKRELCETFDMFMTDKSALPLLPKDIGKSFLKKNKQPIPVDLSRKQWRGEFELACSSTFARVGKGTSYVVKVARVSQPRQEVVENVFAVIEGLQSVWKNVRALHLKSLESLALPIFELGTNMDLRMEGQKTQSQVLNEKPENKKALDRDPEKDVNNALKKRRRIQ
uniref:Ribosomal protein L1 n=1 Tax=Araucaria cunninghamii TaxID=56994 RepID=A0A0D6R439_ARACU